MEPEAFFVLTELGIGLAGFSAIVVAIGQRGGQVERMSRFRLLTLLSTALLAAFGALVPQLLAGLGFAGGSLWRGASALLGVLVVALVVDSEVRRHRLGANERATIVPLLYLAMIVVLAAIALWLAANVLSAAPSSAAWSCSSPARRSCSYGSWWLARTGGLARSPGEAPQSRTSPRRRSAG